LDQVVIGTDAGTARHRFRGTETLGPCTKFRHLDSKGRCREKLKARVRVKRIFG